MNKRLRFEIFKRDLFTCRYCGRKPPDTVLEVDHILPRCEGGQDEPTNLTTSCYDCNRGKGGKNLGDAPAPIDEMEILAVLQDLAERKRQLATEVKLAGEKSQLIREAVNIVIEALCELMPHLEDRHVQRSSLTTFIDLLGLDATCEAVRIAAFKAQDLSSFASWTYFCGVCWKMIKENRPREER